ncbi:MAG: sodium:proton antiporter [Lachnospiraceae bacterium]|nr:sodium:proton antiporter [Lachnospiraceae bacterium]
MISIKLGGIITEAGLSFTVDGFRLVYAVITAFMWAATAVFSKEYFVNERENLNRYRIFTLLTFIATEGVMLSGDLMTTFLFFEILSFTSFTWVIHEETKEAVRAGYTYLFIAVIGGLVLFMGLALLKYSAGTLSFDALKEAAGGAPDRSLILAAGICILFGFGCKAGMFPVHVWLPKAHPVAPSPASALLSGILTKVGIYGILMTSCTALSGNQIFALAVLIPGVITMALGAVLALFSVNLKRTLACSSMSQIGFILTGIGMMLLFTAGGNEEGAGIALSGLMLHMVNHSLIKLTLFMAAGVVMMNLKVLTLDEIRGYGRNKPLLKAAFAFGALGISGVPLFNGYLSKTLLHESIVEGSRDLSAYGSLLSVTEWAFLISGGLTCAYMLKLFICIFVQRNRDEKLQQSFDRGKKCMNKASTAAVFGSSLLTVILGQPFISLRLIEFMTGFEEIRNFKSFTPENLKGSVISLAIGAIIYLTVVRRILIKRESYVNLWPEKLDLEELLYRPLITRYIPEAMGRAALIFGENRILKPILEKLLSAAIILTRILESLTDGLILILRKTVMRERRVKSEAETEPGFLYGLSAALAAGAGRLLYNFTFAMMMTCIGILIVLCTILFIVF